MNFDPKKAVLKIGDKVIKCANVNDEILSFEKSFIKMEIVSSSGSLKLEGELDYNLLGKLPEEEEITIVLKKKGGLL